MKSQMKWGVTDIMLAVIGLLPFGYGVLVYDRLPETMATHFGMQGEADGWQGKGSFLALMALLTLGLPMLMKVTRRIDPRSENYEKFEHVYDIFRLGITLILSAAMGATIFFNLGYAFSMQMFALVGLGLFFIVIGNYMGQVRYNYFIGIKTPWTLADEEVWRRTHRASGPLIVVTGLVSVIAAFLPNVVAAWVFGTVFAGSMLVFPMVYSYLQFQRLRGDGK
ncbi:SdpI family protein [Tumebacillus permanentifrigoris]|uniref:Putative membrane protein n=1 Tax=Tumebacillus permanentifrigoris TaxID=378543 RepID=A0A316DB03_9BACL|nr:SdpI family protein [Tumebacillus permanentifrigoris]PWK14908.1 putative membrane protein [Tumebacillus permanentifrigoris]